MQPLSLAVLFQLAHLFFILLLHSSAIAQTPSTNKTTTITKGANITKPGCPRSCGNLIVPYPFGIGLGSGCALNPTFEINCNTSHNPPIPLISNLQVYEISDTQVWISNFLGSKCYNQTGGMFWQHLAWINLGLGGISTPYTFSAQNSLTVIGCDDEAMMLGTSPITGKTFVKGCAVTCTKPEDVVAGKCLGSSGCCQVPIPKGLKYYNISIMNSTNNHTKVWSYDPCGYFFLGEADRFKFGGLDDLRDQNFQRRWASDSVPIVLDWAIGSVSCDDGRNGNNYACNENSHCVDADNDSGGYRCSCDDGYQGNPYLSQGCQDINECNDLNLNNCEKLCTNLPGSYSCSCPDGYTGDGKKNGSGCTIPAPNSKFPWIKLSVGLGVGFLSLVVGVVTWLYLFYKRRKIIKFGEKTFRRIGGQALKQRITKIHDAVEPIKTFTAEELAKATDNYASDRILGEGGHAIVYKGILSRDQIVAIKTPIKVDHTKIEDFINEVVILTQVKHRNVVKLLGCCLETEVPLLVYEFVSNGTLLEHILKEGETSWLTWENRLRISIEIGSALAFLHSFASPIIHRDIKSNNILVDDNYHAKVSDFGISRLIPLGRTHKTTYGQGTFGCMDPEYFTTRKLTEKSDVYGYGIVLCELLTGLPVLSNERNEADVNLGQYLINSMNKNCLIKILDRRIVKEGALRQIEQVAELAKKCLHSNGTARPTMSQVVVELQRLTSSNRRNDNQSREIPTMSQIVMELQELTTSNSRDDNQSRERPTMSQVVMELQEPTTSNSRNDNQSSETRSLTF